MLDMKFVRENPDAVKENIKKKFQDAKLPLVDEVIAVDARYREVLKEAEALRAERNKLSKSIGMLMGAVKKATDPQARAGAEAKVNEVRAKVNGDGEHLKELETEQEQLKAAAKQQAEELLARKVPGLFRVHDEPSPDKLDDFALFAKTFKCAIFHPNF